MNRRAFATLLGGVAATWLRRANAQQEARLRTRFAGIGSTGARSRFSNRNCRLSIRTSLVAAP